MKTTKIKSSVILASVSFWPLLIIESVARVSQHVECYNLFSGVELSMRSFFVISCTACLLSRYNVKGELRCFNCETGVFLRLVTLMFTKESNYNPRFFLQNSSIENTLKQL